MRKQKYKDEKTALFLSAIIFLGIYLIDKIKDIQEIHSAILFIITFLGLTISIKFMKWVFKWQ